MSTLIVETVTTPDTNTDLTINPNGTGKTVVDGKLDMNGGELILDADADTSITADTDDQIDFKTSGSDRMTINPSGLIGVGVTAPGAKVDIKSTGTTSTALRVLKSDAAQNLHALTEISGHGRLSIYDSAENEDIRLDSNGNSHIAPSATNTGLLIGKTSSNTSVDGHELKNDGFYGITRTNGRPLFIRRNTDDGEMITFNQDGTSEGNISVSGTTVSYNGGHLARWSQLDDGSKDTTIVKGTVMTNLDQMAVWTHAATDDEAEWTEDNEQLNCMAVSSVEGDANVAGVFVNWDNDDDEFNDMNVAMTGDMVIRIAQGTTVARGDLLMSAGDGTAKPQGDDIVRSKTIAKVTSTTVSHTYDDGSYLVPCVLMAC